MLRLNRFPHIPHNHRGAPLLHASDRPVSMKCTGTGLVLIDVSEYEPKGIPSKTWRECIKSVRPDSGKITSFITEASVVRQILEHLNLWEYRLSRDPPEKELLY